MDSSLSKRAVILAGGRGRRLEPYTTVLPKPLMPVGEMSILEVVVRQLVHAGFRDLTMAVGHLPELLMAVCGDGSRWGAQIRYSRETTPLGTAGPLSLITDLDRPFLVMNGDILTDLAYDEVYRNHLESEAWITIATYRRAIQVDLGVVEIDPQGYITGYNEKPTFEYRASMGIYVVDPRALAEITVGQYLDFPDLVKRLIPRGKVRAHLFEGYWKDIGRPDDYKSAIEDFERLKSKLVPGPSAG
jgi:NDP-sugar pyrophosphorylase family protein